MSEDAPTPKRIDLSTYTEPTRRAVYDAVVAMFFSSTLVYYELGRWS
jgi:hypothetical protein